MTKFGVIIFGKCPGFMSLSASDKGELARKHTDSTEETQTSSNSQ